MLMRTKFKSYNPEGSATSISVKEAETLGSSLLSLSNLAGSQRKLQVELDNRSHLLALNEIELFNTYVQSCRETGSCDGNILNTFLSGIKETLETENLSSRIRSLEIQDTIQLIDKFQENLKKKGNEGKFAQVHEAINNLAPYTQSSYNSLLSRLNATPKASIPENNIQQGRENISKERTDITLDVVRPIMLHQSLFWGHMQATVEEALEKRFNDSDNSRYRRKLEL